MDTDQAYEVELGVLVLASGDDFESAKLAARTILAEDPKLRRFTLTIVRLDQIESTPIPVVVRKEVAAAQWDEFSEQATIIVNQGATP